MILLLCDGCAPVGIDRIETKRCRSGPCAACSRSVGPDVGHVVWLSVILDELDKHAQEDRT